jgi:uncharacterized phiE125 gp8 family phage protein
MALKSNALTSLAETKGYLKLDAMTDVDDDILVSLINASTSAIESYCKRKFKEQIHEEDYDGNGRHGLYLHQYPVKSIDTVEIMGNLIPSSSYRVAKQNGKLLLNGGKWPLGEVNITVKYTAGYDEIPFDLEMACKQLIMFYFKTDVANYSTTFQDGFVVRPDSMPAPVKALLSPYRKVM